MSRTGFDIPGRWPLPEQEEEEPRPWDTAAITRGISCPPWYLWYRGSCAGPGPGIGRRGCGGLCCARQHFRRYRRVPVSGPHHDVPGYVRLEAALPWREGPGKGRSLFSWDDSRPRRTHQFSISCDDLRYDGLQGLLPTWKDHADSTRWVVMLDSSAIFSGGAWSPAHRHTCL